MQATFIAPNGNIGYQFLPLGQAHKIGNGFGGFVGYNSQWDDVIVGIEANYIHDGFRAGTSSTGVQFDPANNVTALSIASSSAVLRLSDFGSLRLRGGYVIGCFLPYLFFGAGLGGEQVDRAVVVTPAPLRPAWTTDSKSRLVYGYTAGVGFDVLLTGGLFARLEYEYRRVTADIESNVNTARIGLGYKF
jgi:opacity protein-like surface antigen